MLEFLYDISHREEIMNEIAELGLESDKITAALMKFLDLFEAAQASVEKGIAG